MASYDNLIGKDSVTNNLTNLDGNAGGATRTYGDIKYFRCPDNYIYIYHTDILVVIPTYPESIQDSMGTNYQSTEILSRPAPIQTYVSSGPRTLQVSLNLHRDMMFQITRAYQYTSINSGPRTVYGKKVVLNDSNASVSDMDYIDRLVCELQAIAVPKYEDTTKMINPPMVAARFGNDVFIKGVVSGGVTVTYGGVILKTNKYSNVDISFTITELTPYSAEQINTIGSYRGVSKKLERKIYTSR